MNSVVCGECIAIADEIIRSYREAWASADQAFRDTWEARNKLIGGTEEDVLRAEELFPKAKPIRSGRTGQAVLRKLAHEAMTGHKVPKPPFPL
jgi:hypothetical protein